jgi:hypothetical protein
MEVAKELEPSTSTLATKSIVISKRVSSVLHLSTVGPEVSPDATAY